MTQKGKKNFLYEMQKESGIDQIVEFLNQQSLLVETLTEIAKEEENIMQQSHDKFR